MELRQTYLRADPPCLQYELVEGGDLAGLMYRMQQTAGRLRRSSPPAG